MDPTEHWAIMGASEGHETTPRQSALAALAPSVPHLHLLRRSLSLSRLGRKRMKKRLVTGRKVEESPAKVSGSKSGAVQSS